MSEERDPEVEDDGDASSRSAPGTGAPDDRGGERSRGAPDTGATDDRGGEPPPDAEAPDDPETAGAAETEVSEPRDDHPQGPLAKIARWVDTHRGRIARVLFVAIAVAVLLDLGQAIPADTELRLPLGDAARDVVALEIELRDQNGETLFDVRLRTPAGAPRVVPETFSLAPGRYLVVVEAERRDGTRFSLEGPVEAPAEGVVTVPLRPSR